MHWSYYFLALIHQIIFTVYQTHTHTPYNYCHQNLVKMFSHFSSFNSFFIKPGQTQGKNESEQFILQQCPGSLSDWPLRNVTVILYQLFSNSELEYFLQNYPQVNARPHWWLVNIGSSNGLVLSGNKPFLEPMFYATIWCHQGLLLLTWINFNPCMDK